MPSSTGGSTHEQDSKHTNMVAELGCQSVAIGPEGVEGVEGDGRGRKRKMNNKGRRKEGWEDRMKVIKQLWQEQKVRAGEPVAIARMFMLKTREVRRVCLWLWGEESGEEKCSKEGEQSVADAKEACREVLDEKTVEAWGTRAEEMKMTFEGLAGEEKSEAMGIVRRAVKSWVSNEMEQEVERL